jgi:hypothetical protein
VSFVLHIQETCCSHAFVVGITMNSPHRPPAYDTLYTTSRHCPNRKSLLSATSALAPFVLHLNVPVSMHPALKAVFLFAPDIATTRTLSASMNFMCSLAKLGGRVPTIPGGTHFFLCAMSSAFASNCSTAIRFAPHVMALQLLTAKRCLSRLNPSTLSTTTLVLSMTAASDRRPLMHRSSTLMILLMSTGLYSGTPLRNTCVKFVTAPERTVAGVDMMMALPRRCITSFGALSASLGKTRFNAASLRNPTNSGLSACA